MWPDLLVTHHHLHLLNGGVWVHHVIVGHLIKCVNNDETVLIVYLILLADRLILAPPGQLPVHQAQAVHVSPLPAVKMFLINCFVQQLKIFQVLWKGLKNNKVFLRKIVQILAQHNLSLCCSWV